MNKFTIKEKTSETMRQTFVKKGLNTFTKTVKRVNIKAFATLSIFWNYCTFPNAIRKNYGFYWQSR